MLHEEHKIWEEIRVWIRDHASSIKIGNLYFLVLQTSFENLVPFSAKKLIDLFNAKFNSSIPTTITKPQPTPQPPIEPVKAKATQLPRRPGQKQQVMGMFQLQIPSVEKHKPEDEE